MSSRWRPLGFNLTTPARSTCRISPMLPVHLTEISKAESMSMMSGAVYVPPSIGLPFVAVIFSADEIIATKATPTAEEGQRWVNLIIESDQDDDA